MTSVHLVVGLESEAERVLNAEEDLRASWRGGRTPASWYRRQLESIEDKMNRFHSGGDELQISAAFSFLSHFSSEVL